MSIALIDNATLTAVQRITGAAPSRSQDSVDVDLLAYENYVQARLFYDEVAVVDDYINALRAARAEAFPALRFIDPQDLQIQEIAAMSSDISSRIRPKIEGGDFADSDLRALFDLLQTHMVCTWDITSSVYHLTLKVLAENRSEEFDKYGAVATAIFQELGEASSSGARASSKVELLDRFGQPISDGYQVPKAQWGAGESGAPSAAIGAFVAALVWLSNRAIYYTLVSAHIKADSYLYPIRQAYQQHYLAQTLRQDLTFPKRLVTQLSTTLSRDTVEILNGGKLATGAIDLPIFSAWLVNTRRDTRDALEELETVRNHQDFVDAREQLSELRALYNDNNIAKANEKTAKIADRLQNVSSKMRQKYSIQTQQGVPMTRLVTVYNAYAALQGLPPLPKIDAKIRIPQFLQDMRREVGFCSIYRNVVNDLATFNRLGNIRDVLGRRVHIDPLAHAYSPKAEPPRYRHSHSPFKSPM
jgi:hypothetical protein